MMALAGKGRAAREGVRMGLWGAAQAIAFGLGGFAGTVAVDLRAAMLESAADVAYAVVFAGEAVAVPDLRPCSPRASAGDAGAPSRPRRQRDVAR